MQKIVKHGTPFELFQEHSSISSLRATEKIKNKINVIIAFHNNFNKFKFYLIPLPLLIFHCRTRLFTPSFTADFTGWRSDFTVAGTASEFH